MAFQALSKYEIQVGQDKIKPGMLFLHTLRLNSLQIGEMTVSELCKVTKAIEHIELAGCSELTESGVNKLLEVQENLKFIDINACP